MFMLRIWYAPDIGILLVCLRYKQSSWVNTVPNPFNINEGLPLIPKFHSGAYGTVACSPKSIKLTCATNSKK